MTDLAVCTESGTRVHKLGTDGNCTFCHRGLILAAVAEPDPEVTVAPARERASDTTGAAERMWLIIDNNGIIDSGDEDAMRTQFELYETGAERVSFTGDLRLVEQHGIHH